MVYVRGQDTIDRARRESYYYIITVICRVSGMYTIIIIFYKYMAYTHIIQFLRDNRDPARYVYTHIDI